MRHLKTLNKKAMPQSLVKNNIHLVFSTKNRENMIRVEDYEELRAYLIGVLSGLGCYLEELGGTENHIHANTSRWFHKRYGKECYWQSGFGAFIVSQSKVAVVRNYIRNQIEHHRSKGFEEEFREFLKAYDIEWDEKYVWD